MVFFCRFSSLFMEAMLPSSSAGSVKIHADDVAVCHLLSTSDNIGKKFFIHKNIRHAQQIGRPFNLSKRSEGIFALLRPAFLNDFCVFRTVILF